MTVRENDTTRLRGGGPSYPPPFISLSRAHCGEEGKAILPLSFPSLGHIFPTNKSQIIEYARKI